MRVLIVENSTELGALWSSALSRNGIEAKLVANEEEAIRYLQVHAPDVIIADLDLPGTAAIAVADYAAYRHPGARVIFVTATSFFSDGTIFSHSPNACAFLPARTQPDDLAAVVEFHGERKATSRG